MAIVLTALQYNFRNAAHTQLAKKFAESKILNCQHLHNLATAVQWSKFFLNIILSAILVKTHLT